MDNYYFSDVPLEQHPEINKSIANSLANSVVTPTTTVTTLPEATVTAKRKNRFVNVKSTNSKPTREALMKKLNSGNITFIDKNGKQVKATKEQIEKMKRWVSGPMTGNPPLTIRGFAYNMLRIAGARIAHKLPMIGKIGSTIKSGLKKVEDMLPKRYDNPTPTNGRYISAGKKGLKRLSSSSKAATRNALLNP